MSDCKNFVITGSIKHPGCAKYKYPALKFGENMKLATKRLIEGHRNEKITLWAEDKAGRRTKLASREGKQEAVWTPAGLKA